METTRLKIRWRDLDPFGHVNQAVYQTYAEEVLDAWFRGVFGLTEAEIWNYVTARVAIDYRSELRYADREAIGSCRQLRLGRSSVTTRIELHAPDGRLAAEVEWVAVAWDPERRRPRPLSASEHRALQQGSSA